GCGRGEIVRPQHFLGQSRERAARGVGREARRHREDALGFGKIRHCIARPVRRGEDMLAKVFGLFRYPIKGLSREPLKSVTLQAARGVCGDREFALALPATVFDQGNPQPLPKFQFLMLARQEALARLTTSYDAGTGLLSGTDGAESLSADVRSAEGRGAIAAFFARFLPEDQKSSQPRLV